MYGWSHSPSVHESMEHCLLKSYYINTHKHTHIHIHTDNRYVLRGTRAIRVIIEVMLIHPLVDTLEKAGLLGSSELLRFSEIIMYYSNFKKNPSCIWKNLGLLGQSWLLGLLGVYRFHRLCCCEKLEILERTLSTAARSDGHLSLQDSPLGWNSLLTARPV